MIVFNVLYIYPTDKPAECFYLRTCCAPDLCAGFQFSVFSIRAIPSLLDPVTTSCKGVLENLGNFKFIPLANTYPSGHSF